MYIKIKYFLVVLVLVAALFSQQKIISGFITDSKSGEALIGANIYLKETEQGISTDINGYYAIVDVESDSVTVFVSYIGYKSIEKNMTFINSKIEYNVELEPRTLEADGINVSAEKSVRQKQIQYSQIKLNPMALRNLPSVGEADIFRTLQTLPGVLTASEFSTGLIVRGGNTDQNLILLDGITVYNPSHLGGVFSNFIVDGLKEAELIKGGFNADYGGRLSSVLNVVSREGNRKEVHGNASLSLISSQTTWEGPLPIGNGAWVVSGRRTYIDKFAELIGEEIPYYFYDLQGHVFTDLTKKDRINFSFYSGRDDLQWPDFGLNIYWGNRTFSSKYRKLFSEQLIGNFMLASSTFYIFSSLGGDSGSNSDNVIRDNSLTASFQYYLNNSYTLKFGGQLKKLNLDYLETFNDAEVFRYEQTPADLSSFIKLKWVTLNDRLIVEPGIRFNYYNKMKEKFYPELRLGVKAVVATDQFINFSMGEYHQFMQSVQDDYNSPIIDFWLCNDESVESASSNHFIIGYEQFINDSYKYQFDFYYKDIYNTLTFVDNRSAFDGDVDYSSIGSLLDTGDGEAWGIEAFFQKKKGNLTGWLSYTWSHSTKTFQDDLYYTNWDRRHVLNLVGSWKFRDRWDLSWKWTYQSGQAYTPMNGFYIQQISGEPDPILETIPGFKNEGRLPDYHRLDMNLTYRSSLFGYETEYFIQLINAYNNKNNVQQYFYSVGDPYNGLDDDGDWDPATDDIGSDDCPQCADNKQADVGEPNVDEPDEGQFERRSFILFNQIIPVAGFRIEF